MLGRFRSTRRQLSAGYHEAWVVYLDKPIDSWSADAGDFNQDGLRDVVDIDLLSAHIRANGSDLAFDLFEDQQITDRDRVSWVKYVNQTWFGDANLDGQFSTDDLVQVIQIGKYEKGLDAGWAEGDWDGDGKFSSNDLVFALSDGGYEQGLRAAVSAVPEPSSGVLILSGLLLPFIAAVGMRRRGVSR